MRGDNQHTVHRRGLDPTRGAHGLPEDLDCDDGDYADNGATYAVEEGAEELEMGRE
jgi:hypothetical protein